MVTKPTGRPRGRPKKPKPEKGPRKRPSYNVRKDPQRYLLAALQAHIDCARIPGNANAHQFAHFFAGLWYGELIQTPENIQAMLRGERFEVGTRQRCGNENGERWRDQNPFFARGENLCRKLRRWNDPYVSPNGEWLSHMSVSFGICLDPFAAIEPLGFRAPYLQSFDQKERFAEHLASLAGETEYFNAVMRPMLHERARQRALGATRAEINMPDFFAILRRF